MRYQLTNRNNWHPLTQFMKQFEDELFSPLTSAVDTPSIVQPTMEWQENDKAFLLSFDIPGLKEQDIKVDLYENKLTVSAERKQSSERKEGNSVHSEKFYGLYQRTIELPKNVDPDDVHAEYNNGVLEVLIPKIEKSKARNIQIGKEGKISEKFLGAKSGPVNPEKLDKNPSH